MSPSLSFARAAAFGLSWAAAALAFLRATGEAAVRIATHEPFTIVAPPIALATLAFVALLALAFAWTRLRRGRAELPAAVVAMLASSALAYLLTLPRPPPGPGRLTPIPPSTEFREAAPTRPAVLYRTNEHGFRGVDWGPREAGVTRVAIIGDSFVFGIGVEEHESLAVQLARELGGSRRHEVVNLGVPGNDLRGHVAVYEAFGAQLEPDVTIVCLTSNDFSGWTPQGIERTAHEQGPFSIASFGLGPRAARLVWGTLYALPQGTPEEDRAAALELEHLARLQRRRGERLVVFAYTPSDARHFTVLRDDAVTVLTPAADSLKPEYFLEGDGHPTAAGNAYFARLLAAALEAPHPTE